MNWHKKNPVGLFTGFYNGFFMKLFCFYFF